MNDHQLLNLTERVLKVCFLCKDDVDALTVLLASFKVYLERVNNKEDLKQTVIAMLQEDEDEAL